MKLLGIETSCDETAAAIVDDQHNILSNVVLSQIDTHKVYGGVVPEVAARAHIDKIEAIIDKAFADAGLEMTDIDGIAATCGPGLIGGVMIGMTYAKTLAWSLDKPFIAINHLEGHALTPRLSDNIAYPYLILLVSGGHTQLLIAHGLGQYEQLGSTLDDAVGECFDKSAKVMGLGYPGGPALEKLASEVPENQQETAIEDFPLPFPLKGKDNCDFSFSGLKTSVIRHVEAFQKDVLSRAEMAPLAFALQERLAEVLCERTSKAMKRFKDQYPQAQANIVVAGGVAANKTIRAQLELLSAQEGFRFTAPPMKLCTDNGAMIAWAGVERLKNNLTSDLNFKARPRWPLEELGWKQSA